MLAQDGQTILELENYPIEEPFTINVKEGYVGFRLPPKEVLYKSATDEALIKKASSKLKLQSLASFTTPSPPPAWADEGFEGRLAFVFCHQDKAVDYYIQKRCVALTGKKWRTLDFEESDHCPFMSSFIEPLFEFIDMLGQEWMM